MNAIHLVAVHPEMKQHEERSIKKSGILLFQVAVIEMRFSVFLGGQ
jgi:hypothetical protein